MESFVSKLFSPRYFWLTIILLCATSGFGQADTATITGNVTDTQGSAVAGATVTLTSADKGFTRTVQANGDGAYNFVNIPPGTYVVEVTQGGFKKYVQSGIKALVSNTVQVNVSLEAGNVSEQVTVTSNSIDAIVNTTDATIGNNFQPQQIQQLPTESRNINNLLSLQPGVTSTGYVNGGRSDQANITLDGVDVNDQQAGTAFFSVLRPLAEATEEFRVTTTNANAEQGRSSGAQISLLTKAGTNRFHGVAFWLPRRTFGSANDFFNNSTLDASGNPTPRPNLDRDVFGGAVGGPIIKNKLFFFYAYEGLRETLEESQVSTVPRASLGQGIIRINSTTSISAAQFNALYPGVNGENPAALAFLASAAARYPVNDNSVGDGLNTGGFRFNAPTSNHQNTNVLRLDWNFNDHHQLFFRGQQQSDPSSSAPAFPDTPAPENWSHNTGIAVGDTWTIGSNMINTFRYGLTRQAFTAGGDTNANAITFRFVYQPLNFTYGLSRVTPIQNFTDDFTWIKGNHTMQFGGNVRIIRNKRVDNGASFGTASTNPFYYSGSGRSLLTPLVPFGASSNNADLQGAVAAVIGRFSDYTATYVYDLQGNLVPEGTPIEREFATEEYDVYGQDSWKIRPHLTLNFGLRYSLSRPVYEKNGFQIRPTIGLSDYLDRRIAGAAAGKPYNEILNFELAGPKNNAPGFYSMDKDNFQPRISAAWSPSFKTGFLSKLFGKDNESVFRGGFAITNDYFGQQLAVTFNGLSTLGFVTSNSISPNTYNISSKPGPLFTGVNQRINNLPGVPQLANRFQTPADENARIEQSLDPNLVSPINYSWNFTYGRKLPFGLYLEASYVGRMARNLLLQRDAMQLNNLVDPKSGMDWYTAAGKIYDYYYSGTPVTSVQPIPYFENLFPGLAGAFGRANNTQAVMDINQTYGFSSFGDWTYLQQLLDDDIWTDAGGGWSNLFFQPQYAAFNAWSTVGKSNYHGASLSIRQRLGTSVLLDFNYTFSKSLDDASGLQNAGFFSGSAFVLNSLRQQDSYARSGFDSRHVINANFLVELPFGKGKKFLGGVNNWVNQAIGGWQLGGVFRYNTGTPLSNLIDLAGWATNWEIRSRVVRTQNIQSSITRNPANLFPDLEALRNSVRPARPGETGERNVFFGPSFSELDMNLGKSFTMPWSENHKLQVRWEVFNVLNQQFFSGGSLSAFSISPVDPFDPEDTPSQLTAGTGQFTGIQGIPRRMQFVLRYSF
jgi:hypothetical protein